MAENPGDALGKILQKLESMESDIKAMGSRLEALENVPDAQWDSVKTSQPPAVEPPVREPDPVPPPVTPAPPPAAPPAPDPTPKPGPQPQSPPPLRPMPPISPRALAPGPMTKPAAAGSAESVYRAENQVAPPKPAAPPKKKSGESLEMRIASTWLPRIGVLFLALVLILVAREHVQGPVGKIVGSYLLSFALIAVGLFYDRKYPQWARPVLAGGLAFSYFASYAMGFIEPMRILESLSVKLTILGINLAVIMAFAQWRKSEMTAGTALVLGYLTTGVVGSDLAALCSGLALSVIAVFFLWRNKWFTATAVAAVCTYLAYFYAWRMVPEVQERSAEQAFWFHFQFLSLNFLVYTAAALVGKSPAITELQGHDSPSKFTGAGATLNRLVQINVAAYIGGVIAVLKMSGVYWDRAWMFLLPVAAVCGVAVLLFRGLRAVQSVYATGGVVAFTLGAISLISPMWLPVFLALQAVAMLAAAIKGRSPVWEVLSYGVMLYACFYLFTSGAIDFLGLGSSESVRFPAWTYAAVAAVILGYAGYWEKFRVWSDLDRMGAKPDVPETRVSTSQVASLLPFTVAFLAALVWKYVLQFYDFHTGFLVVGLAVPLVALPAAWFRLKTCVVFVVLTMLFGIVRPDQQPGDLGHLYDRYMVLLGFAGLCAGYFVERKWPDISAWPRFLWRSLYVWSPMIIGYGLWESGQGWPTLLAYTAVALGIIGAAWILRSAALGKSVYFLILLMSNWSLQSEVTWSLLLLVSLAVTAAVYLLGLPVWRARTGDRHDMFARLVQAGAYMVIGLVWCRAIAEAGWNPVAGTGSWALVCAVLAATAMTPYVVWVTITYAAFTAITLMTRLVEPDLMAEPGQILFVSWGVIGVLMVVAAERALHWAPRLAAVWSNDRSGWISRNWSRQISGVLAIGSLVMIIMALRLMPELRVFYFTGAMVGAAFLWIVFGIWFSEPIYRKSGFTLLCVGIVKGLVWDVMSLKNTLYRQVSWTILGLLALAASFLYNKFRGRLEQKDSPDEEQ